MDKDIKKFFAVAPTQSAKIFTGVAFARVSPEILNANDLEFSVALLNPPGDDIPKGAGILFDAAGAKKILAAGGSWGDVPTHTSAEMRYLFTMQDLENRRLRLELPCATLHRMLSVSAHAMADRDIRYYLNGAALDFSPQGLAVTTTDGHRLVHIKPQAATATAETIETILPRNAVLALIRLLPTDSTDCSIVVFDKFVQFCFGPWSVTAKLVDGKFPDYRRVIDHARSAGADTQVLGDSVLTAAKIAIATIKAQCRLKPFKPFPDYVNGFNAQYIVDLMRAFGPVSVRTGNKQGMVYETDEVAAVIMPCVV